MSKNEFARATFYFGASSVTSNKYGVSDLQLEENFSEIDVTDTETAQSESEYLGGRNSRSISFNLFKDATKTDLPLNTQTAITVVFTDGTSSKTYTGNAILLSKSIGGDVDSAVKVAYTGRINGALAEA
jgi:predicted secreted protein